MNLLCKLMRQFDAALFSFWQRLLHVEAKWEERSRRAVLISVQDQIMLPHCHCDMPNVP